MLCTLFYPSPQGDTLTLNSGLSTDNLTNSASYALTFAPIWGKMEYRNYLPVKGRLHLQGVPNRARHPLSAKLTSPCTAGSHPLKKQSTGLFFDSPLAKRFVTVGLCPTPHKGCPPNRVRPLCRVATSPHPVGSHP